MPKHRLPPSAREFERTPKMLNAVSLWCPPDENAEKERLLNFYREHGYEFIDPAATMQRGYRGS